MTNNPLPEHHHWSYEEFAILDVTVTHITPLDGNSGHSAVRVNVGAGSIWLGTEPGWPGAQQDFTIQLMGSNEHELLARALRQIADQLDAAPQAGRHA
ncbi:hypothetical protein ABC195_16475 [Microbacterium sp. 2P01SA-2]|uniref:hypothetical protein n=1 Tax=Microbacterium sp. 2P01SA-2 TaxID=3132290 RepID=UPI00399FE29E